jgi:hypothetical protein
VTEGPDAADAPHTSTGDELDPSLQDPCVRAGFGERLRTCDGPLGIDRRAYSSLVPQRSIGFALIGRAKVAPCKPRFA